MDMRKRLTDLLLALKLKKYKFAESIGVSSGNVSDWFNKPNSKPSADVLSRICEVYGVNLNWLLTGSGPMFQELQQIDGSFLGDTISVPIVGEIAAGEPAELIYEEPWRVVDLPRGLLSFAPPYVVFRVSGDSMAPFVLPGDLVVCSEDWREVNTNGKIMAFRCEDGITLKKLVEDIKRKVTMLVPLNSHYEPMIYIEGDPDIVMVGILDLCIRRYNRV
jgi:SOS-response transcriptional repressor LexA